jgi:hypothetical protein
MHTFELTNRYQSTPACVTYIDISSSKVRAQLPLLISVRASDPKLSV